MAFDGANRTSRLPALRRLRDARAQMAQETAAERAQFVADNAAKVSDTIAAVQNDRLQMAQETSEERVKFVFEIAAKVSDIVIAAQKDLDG